MSSNNLTRVMAGAFALLFAAIHASADLDDAAIGEASGSSATTAPDGVVRITYPRTEIDLTVDGAPLRPFAGLTSWAAFTETAEGAMVMGDTVVFEDEITPALDAALDAGLEVTALHNHFAFDNPKVYFMHIGGMGDATQLARGVRSVWDAVRAVRAASPAPANGFGGKPVAAGSIDPAPLEQTLAMESTSDSGMVKFTIGRDGEMHGVKIGGSMGLTTWAAFTGTNDWAAVDGDFIMAAGEVQPVLHALREAGYYVVALHNHMIGETPAFYFVHFWAKGKPSDLATGLKRVLEAQKAAGR